MATCSNCKKDIGFFSRTYTCLYCGRTLCKRCIKPLDSTEEVLKIYSLLDLQYADIICHEPPLFATRKDVSCPICYSKFYYLIKKIQSALDSCKKVELLPSNYKGKRPTIGQGFEIQSKWHSDWDDCDKELRAQAIFFCCDVVMNIEKERDTETWEERKDHGEGTYTRSRTIWKKQGIAYKLKKR